MVSSDVWKNNLFFLWERPEQIPEEEGWRGLQSWPLHWGRDEELILKRAVVLKCSRALNSEISFFLGDIVNKGYNDHNLSMNNLTVHIMIIVCSKIKYISKKFLLIALTLPILVFCCDRSFSTVKNHLELTLLKFKAMFINLYEQSLKDFSPKKTICKYYFKAKTQRHY